MNPSPAGRPVDQEQQQARKQALIDATLSLLEKKPFRSISIREISELAGMKSAMISYYFGNKEGLFLAAIESKASTRVAALKTLTQSEQPLKEFIRVTLAHFSEDPVLSRFIADEILNRDSELGKRFIELVPGRVAQVLPALIETEQSKGHLRSDLNPKWTAFSLTTLIVMPFLADPVREQAWKIPATTLQTEAWADHIYQLFMQGVQTRPDSV